MARALELHSVSDISNYELSEPDATMLWAVLAVILLPDTLGLAIDDEDNQDYLKKSIDTCPDVGYFFERTLIKQPNGTTTEQCYLCFCKEDSTASCWKRENRRCDFDSIYAMAPKPGRRRHKRSPWSLGNLFFADAIKKIFSSNIMPEVCKPYEGSYSEGCPPADWCTGCTVCDCDESGHWNCHVLSFCPDDGKNATPPPLSKRKNHSRRHLINGPGLISPKQITTTKKPTTKPTPKPKPQHRKPLPTALAKMPKEIVNKMPSRWKKLLSNKKIYIPQHMRTSANTKRDFEKTNKATKVTYSKNNRNVSKLVTILTTTEKHKNIMEAKRRKIETLLSGADMKTKEIVNEYIKTLRQKYDNKRNKLMKVLQNKFKNKPRTINPSKSDPNYSIHQSHLSKNSQNNRKIQRNSIKNMVIKTPLKPKAKQVVPTKWTEEEWKEWVRGRNRRTKREISNTEKIDQGYDDAVTEIEKVTVSTTTPIYIISKYKTVLNINNSVGNNYYKYYTVRENVSPSIDTSRIAKDEKLLTNKSNMNYTINKKVNMALSSHETNYNISNFQNSNESVNVEKVTLVDNTSPNITIKQIKKTISEKDNFTVIGSQNEIINNEMVNRNIRSNQSLILKENTALSLFETNYNISNYQYPNKSVKVENISNGVNTTLNITTKYIEKDIPEIDNYTVISAQNVILNNTEANLSNIQKNQSVKESTTLSLFETNYNISNYQHPITSFKVEKMNIDDNSSLNVATKHMMKINQEINNFKVISLDTEIINNIIANFSNMKSNQSLTNVTKPHFNKKEIKMHVGKQKQNRKFKQMKFIDQINKMKRFLFNTTRFGVIHNITKNIKRKNNFVFNYMKNVFHKLLFQRKGRKSVNKKKHNVVIKQISIIRILCKFYGPCKINGDKKKELKPKINALNKETQKIFRSIQLIKGLLLLISFKKLDPNVIGYIRPDSTLLEMNQTEKLHAILSGTYIDHIVDKPTTELTQVKHIKDNTEIVIKSVSNFAKILNEIIHIITNDGQNNDDILYRIQKNKQPQSDSTLTRIKQFLRQKNNCFNKFLETLAKSENSTAIVSNEGKDKIQQNAASIEQYTRKIIENLRLLQNFAKNKTSHQNRVKRQAVEERDIYQFMLLLMEYLLKQNVHLDHAPANDGIDLLIEAIRSAPDVKKKQKIFPNYKRTHSKTIKSRDTKEATTVRVKFLKQNSSNSDSEDRTIILRPKHVKSFQNTIKFRPGSIETIEELIPFAIQNSSHSIIKENKANISNSTEKNIAQNKEVDLQNIENDLTKERTYDISRSETKSNTSNLSEKNISPEDVSQNETSMDIEKIIESMSGEITDDVDLPFSSNKMPPKEEITTSTPVQIATEKPSISFNWESVRTDTNWYDDSEEIAVTRKVIKVANTTKPKRLTSSPATIHIPVTDDVSSVSKETPYRNPSNIEWLHLKLTPEELLQIKNMDMMTSLDYDVRRDDVDSEPQQMADDVF